MTENKKKSMNNVIDVKIKGIGVVKRNNKEDTSNEDKKVDVK